MRPFRCWHECLLGQRWIVRRLTTSSSVGCTLAFPGLAHLELPFFKTLLFQRFLWLGPACAIHSIPPTWVCHRPAGSFINLMKPFCPSAFLGPWLSPSQRQVSVSSSTSALCEAGLLRFPVWLPGKSLCSLFLPTTAVDCFRERLAALVPCPRVHIVLLGHNIWSLVLHPVTAGGDALHALQLFSRCQDATIYNLSIPA